ncbi:unnamed protein product [Rotaria sordida]|uniref:PPM-type phosphatase domain-containing protein n=1 Tax=Rotaria sordida TaxID=392033 RepID=A0A819QIG1_9BILA|nr:unnamed protein product [Rotaria sordida]
MSEKNEINGSNSSSNNLYLDKPCTKKELYGNELFGFGSMQGWRKINEDFSKYLIPFDNYLWKDWAFFSIFDESLNKIQSNIDYNQLNDIIKRTFSELDKHLREIVHDDSGSIASLIGPNDIYLINIGDSHHKPTVRKEQQRIRRAGGQITKATNDVLRVENQLVMTRALGDYSLDKHIIPALPDIIQYRRDSSASFVIIASDGIWDVINNEQVALFVSQRASNKSLSEIISDLFDKCLQEESSDNMTAFIIKLD